MQNFIPINIVVGDRTYRIKVNQDDEAKVMGIAKQLNDQLSNFKTKYAGKDMQDYLAMVLLWYVSEQSSQSPEVSGVDVAPLLQGIEASLDEALRG